MSTENRPWTYTPEDATYNVDKFTDEGRSAFILILEVDKEIQAARKTLAKLEMASRGFNGVVSAQVTDDMLFEEEEDTTEEE